MCVYSNYVRDINDQMPWTKPFMPGPGKPFEWPILPAPAVVDPRILQEILDIGKRLDRIDKALGLKDCKEEDATKRAFEANLEELIKRANTLKQYGASENQQKASDNASSTIGTATTGYMQPIGGVVSGAQWGITQNGSAQGGVASQQSVGHGTAGTAKGL